MANTRSKRQRSPGQQQLRYPPLPTIKRACREPKEDKSARLLAAFVSAFDRHAGDDWREDLVGPAPVFDLGGVSTSLRTVCGGGAGGNVLYEAVPLDSPVSLVAGLVSIIARLFQAANDEGWPRAPAEIRAQAREALTPNPRGPLDEAPFRRVIELVAMLMRHLYDVGTLIHAHTALRAMYGCFMFAVKFELSDHWDLSPELMAFCIRPGVVSRRDLLHIEAFVCQRLWRRRMPFLLAQAAPE